MGKILIVLMLLYNMGKNETSKSMEQHNQIVHLVLPDNEEANFEIIPTSEADSLIENQKGTLIENSNDIRKRNLYELKDKRVIHKYYLDGTSHIYQNKQEYDKIYGSIFIKNMSLMTNSSSDFDFCYSIDLKRDEIENYLSSVVLQIDTTFKVNPHQDLYTTNKGNYIILSKKKNRLFWYYNRKNFIQEYNITYNNSNWITEGW